MLGEGHQLCCRTKDDPPLLLSGNFKCNGDGQRKTQSSSLFILIFLLQFQFSEDWLVTSNLFVLVVASKGAGKTPSARTFLGPLKNLEKEEMAKFDEGIKSNKKAKKKKRDDAEEDEDVENEAPRKKKEKDEETSFRFHPKTRIVEQITPEALIMSLKSGDGVLVIVSDEFKVNLKTFMQLSN